jgi:hypothetical protein
MKIFDIILDRLNETTLFEMARSRAQAKDMVTDLSSEIVDHLIKLFVFNSPQDKQGWITEINAWLDRIDNIYLKPNAKKIDSTTLYNWLVFDSSPHYSGNYVSSRVKKLLATTYKNVSVYDYDSNHVMQQILNVLNNVCKSIGHDTFTTIENYLP